jgi:hypothetical protein
MKLAVVVALSALTAGCGRKSDATVAPVDTAASVAPHPVPSAPPSSSAAPHASASAGPSDFRAEERARVLPRQGRDRVQAGPSRAPDRVASDRDDRAGPGRDDVDLPDARRHEDRRHPDPRRGRAPITRDVTADVEICMTQTAAAESQCLQPVDGGGK